MKISAQDKRVHMEVMQREESYKTVQTQSVCVCVGTGAGESIR